MMELMNGWIGMSHYYCVHTRLCDDGGMEGTFLDFIRINPPPPFIRALFPLLLPTLKSMACMSIICSHGTFVQSLKKKKHSVNEVN